MIFSSFVVNSAFFNEIISDSLSVLLCDTISCGLSVETEFSNKIRMDDRLTNTGTISCGPPINTEFSGKIVMKYTLSNFGRITVFASYYL